MRLRKTLMLTCAVALTFAAQPASSATRVILNCFFPPQHYVCQSVLPTWISWVEEATEGRVRVMIPPKSVAGPPEQWDAVQKGIADAAVQFSGFIANRVHGPLVAMNPFIATDDAPAMSAALWETQQKFFPDEYKGIKLLSLWVITPTALWSQTDTPITTMDDLKNRKIWALPGAMADLMKSVGAGVVAGPAVQANELISRGVVDGFIGLSPTAVESYQLLPYTKSMTQFERGLYTTSFSLLMNEDKWDEISADDQNAIMAVSGEKFGRMAAQHWVDADKVGYDAMAEREVTIIAAPAAFEEALIELSQAITDAWIAQANESGVDGQAVFDFYTKRLQDLSATN